MTGDIYCIYFYVWGISLHVLYTNKGFGVILHVLLILLLYFQIKTCGFHLLEEREELVEDMYQH